MTERDGITRERPLHSSGREKGIDDDEKYIVFFVRIKIIIPSTHLKKRNQNLVTGIQFCTLRQRVWHLLPNLQLLYKLPPILRTPTYKLLGNLRAVTLLAYES